MSKNERRDMPKQNEQPKAPNPVGSSAGVTPELLRDVYRSMRHPETGPSDVAFWALALAVRIHQSGAAAEEPTRPAGMSAEETARIRRRVEAIVARSLEPTPPNPG